MRIFGKEIREIPICATEYPDELRSLIDAPEKLYAVGDISLLGKRKFAVVGSRRTPANALRLGAEIVKELSNAFVIVTGTADGGDLSAVEGALKGSGRVICVLAGGFGHLPQANLGVLEDVANRGLLLSACEYDTGVRAFSYEYRNKLIACLSEGALVLGAGEKSGALITAKHAKAMQKKMFALPYAPNSSAGVGCNAIIKNGGYLTESAKDVFDAFGIEASETKKAVSLSADEEKMLEAVKELCEGHIAELSQKSGLPSFKARAVLSALEVKGLVASVGGNRYAVV